MISWDDGASLRHHLLDEILHAVDAVGHRLRRPLATTAVERRDGGIEGLVALGLPHHRIAADFELLQRAIRQPHTYRRQHGLALTAPRPQLAIDQPSRLMDRRRKPLLRREFPPPSETIDIVFRW